MSAETQPISPAAFAAALESLPAENLYAKTVEIRNAIAHLDRSNIQLQEYSDSIANDTSLEEGVRGRGDAECLEAIRENEVVIERMHGRIALLRNEVERRGGRWHEVEDGKEGLNGNAAEREGANGDDGEREDTPELTRASTMDTMHSRGGPGVGLSDEVLRRQLAERMRDYDDGDEGAEGMHL